MDRPKTVAVIGASRHRSKFGNIAVRAYRAEGWTVFPVNPAAARIEGLGAYPSIEQVPVAVQRVLLYVQPSLVESLLDGIAASGAREIFFNPGTETGSALQRARQLGLDVHAECAIVAIGRSPAHPD